MLVPTVAVPAAATHDRDYSAARFRAVFDEKTEDVLAAMKTGVIEMMTAPQPP